MAEILIYLIIAVLFTVLGVIIGKLTSKVTFEVQKTTLEKELSTVLERVRALEQSIRQLQEQIKDKNLTISNLQQQKEGLSTLNTKQDATISHLNNKLLDQKKEIENLNVTFKKEFENLANKILEEKSTKFTHQNKENIKNILEPLEKKINLFEKKVADSDEKRAGFQSALATQLNNLKALNLKMSQDALNLTKALKGDTKMQGNWGELVLERVLEKSGLEKDREYYVQQNFTNQNGKKVIPDVIIHLPNNKKMVVDSKVSLVAYEQFVNEDDATLKQQHLKKHLTSLQNHILQLSAKKYEDIYNIDAPDFVLLFMPIEPAFAVALKEDSLLYNKAFDKNIVIVTPTTLLATLRTIDTMWTNEKQQRNAIDIARQAGALYDKFEGLLSDLLTIGKKLDDGKTAYSNAINKLSTGRGNIITSLEKIKAMGAKAKKTLPDTIVKSSKLE